MSTSTPVTNGTAPHPTIPIIDFTPWTSDSGTPEQRLAVAKDLISACREFGFVSITHHGVPASTLEQAFQISKQFFSLPLADKKLSPHPPGWAHHRGYSWPGLEKVSSALSTTSDPDLIAQLRSVTDHKESFEIGSDANADQPNIWPPAHLLPSFRPFMSQLYTALHGTASLILRALAVGLGLPSETHLLSLHSGTYNQLRLLHYPPIPAALVESGTLARMPAHTDWSTITLLFQDATGGLQVEAPHHPGQFLAVDPVPDAVVLNVGDLLQRWSNDVLRSTSHRVGLPPRTDMFDGPDRVTRERYSIPYFVSTDPERVVEVLPPCVRPGETPKYEPITQRAYAEMRARMQY